jgi:hypothetical protein
VTGVLLGEASEIVALRVFERAERDGQTMTWADCERAVSALAEHPDGCGCGVCRFAPRLKPGRIHAIASAWQGAIRARSVMGHS